MCKPWGFRLCIPPFVVLSYTDCSHTFYVKASVSGKVPDKTFENNQNISVLFLCTGVVDGRIVTEQASIMTSWARGVDVINSIAGGTSFCAGEAAIVRPWSKGGANLTAFAFAVGRTTQRSSP